MANLLERLEITDSVNQLGAFGTLTLVPDRGQVHGTNRYQALTALTNVSDPEALPRVGQSIQPDLYFNGNYMGSLITGGYPAYITHSDDLLASDAYSYTLTLTGEDPDAAHNRKTTFLFSSPDKNGGIRTYVDCLRTLAASAQANVNVTALPDFKLFGTLEFIGTSLLEAMNMMVGPFNGFDYLKYYVRYSGNRLEYLVIDYTKQTRGAYAIPNIISTQRSYARYTRGNLIGDQNIIITGGERAKMPEEQEADEPDYQFLSKSFFETQRFTSQVNQQVIAQAENWAETEVNLRIDVTLKRLASDTPWVAPLTLADAILDLQQGFIDDIKINNTIVLYRVERQYNNIEGLINETESSFTYETRVFNNGVIRNGVATSIDCNTVGGLFEQREVLVYETRTSYIFPTGERMPTTQTRTWYAWNGVGVVEAKTTMSYTFFRDQWVVTDTSVAVTDPQELLSATVQFWSEFQSQSKGIKNAPPVKRPKPLLSKWRTKDGELVKEKRFQGDNCEDIDATDLTLNGYEISVPGAQLEGLRTATRIAQKQKALEGSRSYWEDVTLTSTIDLNIHVGMPVSANGRSGYVDEVRHTIDQDVAITTTRFRFLHQ